MPEQKTQLYIRDDRKFTFRKLPLQYSCLLEKKGEKIVRAWRHSYIGEYLFLGYKNMSADMVTLSFGRDIFLDPHNKIPQTDDTSGKPKDIKKWIGQVGENMRFVYRAKAQNRSMNEWINYTLMGIALIMVIVWAIRFSTGG